MRGRRIHLVLAVLYVGTLATIALWPTPVDAELRILERWPIILLITDAGWSVERTYLTVQAVANVVLFVPLGWFGIALLPRLRWWHVTLVGFAGSFAIETAQALARPYRFATWEDVATNTLGALIGSLAATWLLRRGDRRRSA